MSSKIKICVLVSGGGSNLQAIINACQTGFIDGNVVLVGTDNPHAGGILRAKKHGIPTFVVNYKDIIQSYRRNPESVTIPNDFNEQEIRSKLESFSSGQDEAHTAFFLKTRAIAEAQLLKSMAAFSFDLLVLAGFMRSLTPYFIDKINRSPNDQRIMNIHPALLPAFPGVDGYGDTFRYGCKVGGCTVHFIDYGEDSGPIISQAAFVIEATDNLDTIKKKGLALEWELYPKCIQQFAQGRLKTETIEYSLKNDRRFQRTVVRILPEKKSRKS
jgi:phosphoribosylglycinamide formyltransferase-1